MIINASVFDSKVRRRVMYALRKELPAKKVASKIKTTNTTLVATVDNPAIKDPDMLYMEYILPILKGMKVELTDDKVFISGRTITIRN